MNLQKQIYTAPLIIDGCFHLSKNRLPGKRDWHTAEEVLEAAYSYQGFGVFESIEPSPRFPQERVEENKSEFAELANKVARIDPKTVLEIGTARGGSLFLWTQYLSSLERICSIDLGSHIDNFEERTRLFDKFADIEMNFVIADSHLSNTREVTERKLDQTVDFLFIDGDHSYEGVKSDFQMYRDLVSNNGLIAFHDIVNEEWPGVGRFWREIKPRFETTEIIRDPERIGIGIIELDVN
jgi:predicted O-methyltransferase YrrM